MALALLASACHRGATPDAGGGTGQDTAVAGRLSRSRRPAAALGAASGPRGSGVVDADAAPVGAMVPLPAKIWQLVGLEHGACLDGGDLTLGRQAAAAACDASRRAQAWDLRADGTLGAHGTVLCLGARGGRMAVGTQVVLQSCHVAPSSAQAWARSADGQGFVLAGGLCLQLGADGGAILGACNAGDVGQAFSQQVAALLPSTGGSRVRLAGTHLCLDAAAGGLVAPCRLDAGGQAWQLGPEPTLAVADGGRARYLAVSAAAAGTAPALAPAPMAWTYGNLCAGGPRAIGLASGGGPLCLTYAPTGLAGLSLAPCQPKLAEQRFVVTSSAGIPRTQDSLPPGINYALGATTSSRVSEDTDRATHPSLADCWAPVDDGGGDVVQVVTREAHLLTGLAVTWAQANDSRPSDALFQLEVSADGASWRAYGDPPQPVGPGGRTHIVAEAYPMLVRGVRVALTPRATGLPGICMLRAFATGEAAAATEQLALGHDLSSMYQAKVALGQPFSDPQGEIADAPGASWDGMRLVAAHGANLVRLRLWHTPPQGFSDLAAVIEASRMARAAGMEVLLDVHLSDTWADPEQQSPPAAWAGMSTLADMTAQVRSYLQETVASLIEAGVTPAIVAIGHEVNNGLLWADQAAASGRVTSWDDAGQMGNLAALLSAGIDGVQAAQAAAGSGSHIRTMLHVDGCATDRTAFFAKLPAVAFDQIGVSCYAHDSPYDFMGAAAYNLQHLLAQTGKDVLIVETKYPYRVGPGDLYGTRIWPWQSDGFATQALATRDLVSLAAWLGRTTGRRSGLVAYESAAFGSTLLRPGETAQRMANAALFDAAGVSDQGLAAFEVQ